MQEDDFIKLRRGKWSQLDVPHKGWFCVDLEDTDDASTTCEMCESQEIRYVHHMKHDQYPSILKVGCVCAGNMEENLTEAMNRDNFLKSRSNKRKKWLDRNWRVSQKGNDTIKSGGFLITIFESNGMMNYSIKTGFEEEPIFSKKQYMNSNTAKLAAFDRITLLLIENMRTNNI